MRKVVMVVHEAEEGGFWASFPELPGCFTQGETLDELREHAQEAVALYLETKQDAGEALPDSVLSIESLEVA